MRYAMRYGTAAVALGSLLMLTAGALEGQVVLEEERQTSFMVRAGGAFPASDLADRFDPGFSVGLGMGFPMAERLRLLVEGDVSMLSDIVRDGELGTGEARQFFEGDLRLWHYGAGLEADLVDPRESRTSFVVHGGLGATTIDPERIRIEVGGEDPVIEEPETRTRFTANAGLGLGYAVSRNVDVLLDGRVYAVFLEDEDFEREGTLEDEFDDVWWSFPLQLALRLRAP